MQRPRWDRLAIVLMCLAAFLDAGINGRSHASARLNDDPVQAIADASHASRSAEPSGSTGVTTR